VAKVSSVTLKGTDWVTLVSMVVMKNENGTYGTGRFVARRGVPVDSIGEEAVTGAPATHWRNGVSLEEANQVVDEVSARLIKQGFTRQQRMPVSEANHKSGLVACA